MTCRQIMDADITVESGDPERTRNGLVALCAQLFGRRLLPPGVDKPGMLTAEPPRGDLAKHEAEASEPS